MSITLFLSSVSRSASPFLSDHTLGTESFLGGTSAIYHATPGKGTTAFAFFKFYSYTRSYSVYRKWACGAATAKALRSL